MAARLGTVFVELDLDRKKFTAAEQDVLAKSIGTTVQLEKNWRNLGSKSSSYYDAMRTNIIKSYETIKNDALTTSIDIVRAEKLKNDRLKQLNKEMVGDHEMSMAAMMRGILRLYAAYYVVSAASRAIATPFIKGFEAVEQLNTSVAAMASMVMSFSKKQEGLDVAGQWKNALSYSEAIIPVIERIAAKTLLSGQETTALANAFARAGVFLNQNNEKQVEGFTRLSNALPLMTSGQEIMRQINTEIRSLMTGANAPSAMLLITLKALDPQIEKHLEMWRAEGTVLEHIGDLLVGFGPATKILENQWEAVKSTIDTTATQILREIMKPAYEDIIQAVKDLDSWLIDNKETIIDWSKNFRIGLIWIEAELTRVGALLDNLGGKLAAAQMYLYGPGAALGFESSTKRFEAAADRYMEYESRYNEKDRRLQELANDLVALQDSMTPAGKAAASAAIASQKPPTPGPAGTQFDSTKYDELIANLQAEYRIIGMSEARQQAFNAARSAGVENLPDKYKVILDLMLKIDAANKSWAQSEAIKKFNDDIANQIELLGKSEAEQTAMNFAWEEGLAIGGKAYNKILEQQTALVQKQKEFGQSEEIKKLNEDLLHQAELIGKSEAEQQALNFAWQNGLEIGGKAYNKISEAISDVIQKQREYNENIADAKYVEDFKSSLVGSVDEIAELPKTEEEKISESYSARKEMLRAALASGIIDHRKYSEMVVGLNKKKAEDIAGIDKSLSDEISDAVKGWASNWSAALNDMVWKADVSFGEILTSFAKMITQMVIQKAIVEPLLESVLSFNKSADGNVFAGGKVIPFANGGIVTAPTIFPMARGVGLMGEAGPEAVMPLTRTSSGKLGVASEGTGMIVNIYEAPGTKATAEQSSDGMSMNVMIEQIENTIAGRANRGTGLGPFFDSRYARAR